MSWDCSLVDPVTRETLETDKLHDIAGGTYCLGGTREMWLNVTYNYSRIFRKVLFPPADIKEAMDKQRPQAVIVVGVGKSKVELCPRSNA